MHVHGGDAVGLAVLFQAHLLFVQVHRGRVDSCALQVQTDPLTPQPPEHGPGGVRGQNDVQRDIRPKLNCFIMQSFILLIIKTCLLISPFLHLQVFMKLKFIEVI